jgi:two-component system NtrC family response regulator
MSATASILTIDDDALFNELLRRQLAQNGYAVHGAQSWAEAEEWLRGHEPDLVLLDIRLPDVEGLEILHDLVARYPVIVLTAYGSVRQAVEAMRQGAAEYLVKPVNLEELELTVARTLGHARLKERLDVVQSTAERRRKSWMVGSSAALKRVSEMIDAVAGENVTVLITGESGSGKELVAREIHERSRRASGEFVTLDCCTLQENLFESELFGHEKGAFTGAERLKKGLIEGARGGTLFLDEIGEIGPAIQAKLLRVMETGEFRRLGGTKTLHTDARIICATNRDLARMAKDGSFRADLYYRLSTFVIEVPPLRERREDIPALVEHFLQKHDFSRRVAKEISPQALDMLMAYDWPGNVRELRNVIERAIILSGDSPVLHPRHLVLNGQLDEAGHPRAAVRLDYERPPTLEELKEDYFRRMYARLGGRRAELARVLGISERNVYRLIEKYGLRERAET